MKYLKSISAFFILSFFSSAVTLYAQAPQSFSYQAVARDMAGNIIANKAVSLRFSILDGSSSGTVVYQETQSATTNVLGLCNVSVGQGTVTSGNFSTIGWGSGGKFLKVEIDPNGGSSYTVMGTTQMLSVPYALYAGNGGLQTVTASSPELTGNGTSGNPLKLASQGAANGQVLKYNGTNWVPAADNDAQTLSINGNQLSISNGNTVTLPSGGGSLNILSVSMTGDNNLPATSYTNLPGLTLTFTPTSGNVLVEFSASGIGSTGSPDGDVTMVEFRVMVNGVSAGGANEKVSITNSWDAFAITPWGLNFSKYVTVNPGVSNTITVQYRGSALYGDPTIGIYTNSAANHATLTVFNQ